MHGLAAPILMPSGFGGRIETRAGAGLSPSVVCVVAGASGGATSAGGADRPAAETPSFRVAGWRRDD